MKQSKLICPADPPPPEDLDPTVALPKRSKQEQDTVKDLCDEIDVVLRPPTKEQKGTSQCCGTTDPCKRWEGCNDCNTCKASW